MFSDDETEVFSDDETERQEVFSDDCDRIVLVMMRQKTEVFSDDETEVFSDDETEDRSV